jgi:hypothetical protein
MFTKTRISKDNKLLSGRNTMDGTKDGDLSMLTQLRRKQLRAMTLSMDSILIDSCTSDQDSQCKELLMLIQPMLDLEDTVLEQRDNSNGNSIESRTLSSLTTPEATQCLSNPTEMVHT